MIAATVVITVLYVLAMLFLLYGFAHVRVFCGKAQAPECTFSIVIPYRNEAENLPSLFASLQQLKYSPEKFEILAVDDASEDASAKMWEEFQKENPQLQLCLLQNIHKSGSPKKDAIALAISAAGYDYILTTDADCAVPENWLRAYNAFILETGASAVAGPVALKRGASKMSFPGAFEEMDILSLQAATMGGFGVKIPFMCNGANFCYSKKAFLKVNGFEGNNKVASGDDVFLLEKFKKKGFKIAFLKSIDAVVTTTAASGMREMFSQRIRWAGKTSATGNSFGKGLGLLVFLMNFSLAAACIAMVFGFFPASVLMGIFLFKFNVDFLLIYRAAGFFKKENSLKSYFWSSIIYPFFSSLVVILSIFSGYEWKGRRFRK